MAVAQDIINSAFRLVGVLDPGETPSASESQTGLERLNALVDAWAVDRISEYSINPVTVTLTTGTEAYTVTPRVVRVQTATVTVPAASGGGNGSFSFPVKVLTAEQWAAMPKRAATAAQPSFAWFDAAFPTAQVHVYPVMGTVVGTRTLNLYAWKSLAQWATLATDIAIPPAYLKAIQYNLAVDLAPEFGRAVDGALLKNTEETKATLRAMSEITPAAQAQG